MVVRPMLNRSISCEMENPSLPRNRAELQAGISHTHSRQIAADKRIVPPNHEQIAHSACYRCSLYPRFLLIADPDHPYLDLVPGSSLDHLRAASVAYRIAIGPHAGRKALTLYSVPPLEEASRIPLLAKMAGFSLHAATVCEAHQRSRLERLCRCITRPPVTTKRLLVDGQGRVI